MGSSETIRVDVWVIAATNLDLLERVQDGRFREDLYYRLNVARIQTSPFRDRTDNIPQLVLHFIEKICAAENTRPPRVLPETIAASDRMLASGMLGRAT